MHVTATVEDVSKCIEQWLPGQRAWFWFCPELTDSQPVLAVRSLSEDARMTLLRADTEGLAPATSQPLVGLASADAQGAISLGGEGLTEAHLQRLSQWVKHNLSQYPALARLRDAEMVRIEDGVITERIRETSLWQGIPTVAAPGSLAETARRLSKLKAGHDFWYWMTTSGPGGRPFLTLGLRRRDPDGKAFVAQVRRAQRAAPAPGQTSQGVLRQLKNGELLFTSSEPVETGVAIVQALLVEAPESLSRLATAQVVQTRDGQFVHSARPQAPADLSRQVAVLEALSTDPAVLFWLSDGGTAGSPVLLLETDRAALKAAATPLASSGRSLRGQLRRSKSGWLELRSQKFWPEGLAVLATWVAEHQAAWPALAALRGVRMTQRSEEGEVLARHKDDGLWGV
ncbi:MAG: hypothetical protein ACI8RZ_005918 [Myxococcota bacterium]